jgi:Alcohol dehydrogenase GroES-like domain
MNSYRAVVRSESRVELVQRVREPLDPECVRVQIKRTGLCRTDCRAAQGLIWAAPNVTLGHEASGVVIEVGEVMRDRFHVGQPVALWPHLSCHACDVCRLEGSCQSMQLGVDCDGTFAEEVVVPAANIHPFFDEMTFERAAYFEPLVAALGALVPGVKDGDTMHVHGSGRIAELTRRMLRRNAHPLVAIGANPKWCVLPTPSIEAVNELTAKAPNTTFVIKLASRGVDFDREAYTRTGARFVTAMYGSKSRAISMLLDRGFEIDDLFETPLPLSALPSRLISNDSEEKKAFFSPELPD